MSFKLLGPEAAQAASLSEGRAASESPAEGGMSVAVCAQCHSLRLGVTVPVPVQPGREPGPGGASGT
eukprot:2892039-Rhodomonas_salina.3